MSLSIKTVSVTAWVWLRQLLPDCIFEYCTSVARRRHQSRPGDITQLTLGGELILLSRWRCLLNIKLQSTSHMIHGTWYITLTFNCLHSQEICTCAQGEEDGGEDAMILCSRCFINRWKLRYLLMFCPDKLYMYKYDTRHEARYGGASVAAGVEIGMMAWIALS